MTIPEPKRRPRLVVPLAVALVLIGALAMIVVLGSRPAATPEPFAGGIGFAQALDRSNETGKPVLALATADWCGPCQHFKREALADARVQAWINENTVPVLLDVTGPEELNADAAAAMNVRGIPALIMLRDDSILSRIEGALPAEQLLAWLEEAAATPEG